MAQRMSSSPPRTKRITRSQSHEILGHDEIGKKTGRRIRHGIRETSLESLGSERGHNGRQSTRNKPHHDLPTVTEITSVVYPSIPTNNEDNEHSSAVSDDEFLGQDGRRTKTPEDMSGISGTTAQTSFSAQELEDGDPDKKMLDALESLDCGADEVLRFVIPQETVPESLTEYVEDLQSLNTRRGKPLIRLARNLQSDKEPFGHEQYVNTSINVRRLLGVRRIIDLRDGPWRADEIFYKANIATMMVHIFSTQGDAANKESVLENLERNFARPFFSKLLKSGPQTMIPIGESRLYKESFELALELRTQYTIMLLNRNLTEENFDPDKIVAQVFYEDVSTLKGWDSEGLRTQDINSVNRKKITERIKQIRTMFKDNWQSVQAKQVVDIDRLNATYPWSAFVVKALLWSKLRQEEIESQLTSVNGVNGIKEAIEDYTRNRISLPPQDDGENSEDNGDLVNFDYHPSEISHTTSEPIETHQKAPLTASKKSNREYSSPQDALNLRGIFNTKTKLVAQQKPQTQTVSPTTGLPHSTVQVVVPPSSNIIVADVPSTAPANTKDLAIGEINHDYFQPLHDDDESILGEDGGSSPASRILEIADRTAAEQNKENLPQHPKSSPKCHHGLSLLDKQPNAKKVSFESQLSTQPGTSASSKRQHPTAEAERNLEDRVSDPSEDEGFQDDQRPEFSRPTTSPTSTKRVASRSESRLSDKRPRAQARLRTRQDSTERDEDYRDPPARTSETPTPSQSEMYPTVQAQSRLVTERRAPKKVQTRRAWTEEETGTLIELIEHHGYRPAHIKEIDGGKVLGNRTQTDIKDKARNIRFDYEKAGITLPVNFDTIPLSKQLKDRLLAAGVDIDR